MSLDHVLQDSRDAWLDLTGDLALYRDNATGRVTETTVTVELETEVMDSEGLMVRHKTASVPSSVAANARRGDTITISGTGKQ